MFRELLSNQINDFNPSVIIISYSGKLTIENRHFIEIIKEMVRLGNYKVMLFPNLTKTYLFEDTNDSDECLYFSKEFETSEQGVYLERQSIINTDLLEKLSIFTKISSGTYNLSQPY